MVKKSTASSKRLTPRQLSKDMQRLAEGRLHDPFIVLGKHYIADNSIIRAWLPGANKVRIEHTDFSHSIFQRPDLIMQRIGETDLFEYSGYENLPPHYRLLWQDKQGQTFSTIDPYSFAAQITDFDLHLIKEGKHHKIYQVLGANHREVDGISGVLFATWAPNAQRVSVIGDFNRWNGLRHPMRCRGSSGIWELFIPEVRPGDCYKFEICHRDSGKLLQKMDIYGQQFELRPKTASVIKANSDYHWHDQLWLEQRLQRDWQHGPMSIYECHLGSWRRHKHGQWLNYRELAEQLVPYIQSLGFTHIELLPITEHPFDGSWGYQTLGYFAPSSRFGDADDFRYFVDYCHQHHIGVLLDWVASHFPKDDHGLREYDGGPLYEYGDPLKGEHQAWDTLVFDYDRNEVKNFLIANALFWLEEFHLDGLRVDAVASMLYLDYSRPEGQWQPNIHGGNENLEAVKFLQTLNERVHHNHPGVVVIAEESTAWPQVSSPTYLGGLGFSMKWNMGWMHDTLEYMQQDPIYRHYHHDKLTFGLLYAWSENFVLALSHDEVVHEKKSLLEKMPGDNWQKFANLRLLYTYLFTYPGKKLLFMGSEFAQRNEWDHDQSLDWSLLQHQSHRGVQQLVSDLNKLYCQQPALYAGDFSEAGFQWLDCHDSDQSVLSYIRYGEGQHIIVIVNFTPVPRYTYRIGVPKARRYREQLNSDSSIYDGSNVGNWGEVKVDTIPWMGYEQSIALTLPPLAGLILIPE